MQQLGVRILWASHGIWQVTFYFLAIVTIIALSFWSIQDFLLTPGFSLANYHTLASNPTYQRGLTNSITLGLITALLSIGLSLPLSCILVLVLRRWGRTFVLWSLALPYVSSYVVRTFSWLPWLKQDGILDCLLGWTGLQFGVLYTQVATVIGLLSMLVPIATVLIYLSLSALDPQLVQAARNLGASLPQIARRIVLPFALPGMLIAFFFSFAFAIGDFICPSILGGNNVQLLSTQIVDRAKIHDWPLAGAITTLLLAITLGLMVLIFGILQWLPITRRYPRNG